MHGCFWWSWGELNSRLVRLYATTFPSSFTPITEYAQGVKKYAFSYRSQSLDRVRSMTTQSSSQNITPGTELSSIAQTDGPTAVRRGRERVMER